jgi:hypothetical protein
MQQIPTLPSNADVSLLSKPGAYYAKDAKFNRPNIVTRKRALHVLKMPASKQPKIVIMSCPELSLVGPMIMEKLAVIVWWGLVPRLTPKAKCLFHYM